MNVARLACCCWLFAAPALLTGRALLAAEPADVLAPNENLVVEGIPPVPSSLAESASRYCEYRHATLLDWHPTERSMLIGTRFGDTNQVHHVATPGGDRRQLTFFADRVTGASYNPVLANHFVFSRDHGGNEFFQYYVYDLNKGESTLLTDGASRNTGALWARRSARFVYGSTRRNKSDVDFYLTNLFPQRFAAPDLLVKNEGGGWHAVDWSDDDGKLLAMQSISINQSYAWMVDVNARDKKQLTPNSTDERVANHPIAFSDGEGQEMYLLTDRDSDFMRLGRVGLAPSSKISFLTPELLWDVEIASLSKDRKKLAVVVNDNGISHLTILDAEKKHMPVKFDKPPVGVISNVQWHENNRDLGFVVTSAQAPGDVYSVNVLTGRLDRWTTSETGGLAPTKFVEPGLVAWKTFDNRTLSGFLYRPPERFTGKRPVIINIHGGPEGQARPTFLGRNNYFINELGVAMLFPNVRGSAGFGKTSLTLDDGFKREDTYKDIGALLDWIATDERLDADRVMVTGASYGGHMTLAVATRYSDRIRCALDVVGISNLVTMLEHTESYRRDLRRAEYGDERDPKMREFLESIAPINHAADIKKPLFVVQGKNDPRVPLSESQQIIAAVRKNQTPVWYLQANDEGHGFAKKKNADYQFYATIQFVKKFLLDESHSQ